MKCSFQIANCELYRYSYDPIDSRMYILVANRQALVIDPCIDEAALQLLNDMDVSEILVLPTHEHYDHISGINWLKTNFRSWVIASEPCAQNMGDPKRNASAHFESLFIFAGDEERNKIAEQNIQPYSCLADEVFSERKKFLWQNHTVELVQTPGHSKGSVCIIVDSRYVFTGDSLLKGMPTITRLPGGSKSEYEEKTLPFLRSLPPELVVFPGHGDAGYITEFFID